MQHEIQGLQQIYEPRRPFLAVIAGSKFDTKIGPLRSLLETVDNLMLGGVIVVLVLAWLTSSRLTPVVVIHVNHHREIDSEVIRPWVMSQRFE